ncbi:MAG: FtsQ-type POTRA domain-containing protein [Armatimonadota bacterium]|nr:FtsQ-type POTRA domain-containing protein [Armatimonadota bacterium]
MTRSYRSGKLSRSTPRTRSSIVVARSKNRERPNLKALVLLFLCSAVLSCCTTFGLQTPLLAVREVKVTGVRLANREKVKQAASTALGRNILLVPSWRICRSIAALPEVSAVRLHRDFPGRVEIAVTEHRPFAAVVCSCGTYLLRPDGLVFHVGSKLPSGIPIIRTARPVDVRIGRKCTSDDILAAIKAVKTAGKYELCVAEISIDRLGDMCLNMCSGLRVKLGQPDGLGEKIAVLRSALTCKPALAYEAQYIDVTCPKFPVYRPKSDGA